MAKKASLSNSIQLLYTIFVLTVVNLGYFVLHKDSQSLFLFICISAVVYLLDCNIMYSLLYSLIIVNGLNFLRKIITINKEGFDLNDSTELSDEEKVSIINLIQKTDNDDMLEYMNYNESIDGEMLPLSTIIDNISNVDVEEENVDLEVIDNLIDYIKKITTMEEAPEDELTFVNKMVELLNIGGTNQEEEELETTNNTESNDEEIIEKKESKSKEKSKTLKNILNDTIKQKKMELNELRKEYKTL